MPHPLHSVTGPRELPIRARTLAPHQIVAALEGRLTQLRYPVVDEIPDRGRLEALADGHGWDVFVDGQGAPRWMTTIRPPLGVPGAKHWIQEPYARGKADDGRLYYRASHEGPAFEDLRYSWRSSRQMPRQASRLLIEVREIRLGRLSDMREEDVVAEGILSERESRTLKPLAYAQEDWEWRFGRNYPWKSNTLTWIIRVDCLATPAANNVVRHIRS